jgi:hypothetical protein
MLFPSVGSLWLLLSFLDSNNGLYASLDLDRFVHHDDDKWRRHCEGGTTKAVFVIKHGYALVLWIHKGIKPLIKKSIKH